MKEGQEEEKRKRNEKIIKENEREITMNKWEKRWTCIEVSAWIKRLIPDVIST